MENLRLSNQNVSTHWATLCNPEKGLLWFFFYIIVTIIITIFYLGGHEIAWALFNGDLIWEWIGHAPAVPVQTPVVVVVSVEKVHFAVCLLYGFVHEQHLQQRSCAAFPHAYNDRL